MNAPVAGERIGVMVCGHGSRSEAAVHEFAQVAVKLRDRFPDWPVAHGYLEFANPVIRDGLDALRARNVTRVLAVPGMLFAASHAKNDIPSVLNTYQAKHGLRIDYGRDLGVDAKMLRAAGDRVEAALDALNRDHGARPNSEVCLVVIGRGASDPDANADVAKVARLLWEGFGFGWCETGYSGVTFPLVEPCLERVVRLGFPRVIVFPYFLFTGILVDRIYGFTDRVAARHPEIAFAKAGYLNDHPLVIDTFAERVAETLEGGRNVMNCGLCKYREQVLGFEHEVGLPQESHHHHVEGKGASAPGSSVADCKLCEDFCTGACRVLAAGLDADAHHDHGHYSADDHSYGHGHGHGHSHDHSYGHHDHSHDHDSHDQGHEHGDHHHHPYPHAAHPLGPVSVLVGVAAPGVDATGPARTGAPLDHIREPARIYAESFARIRVEADLTGRTADEARIAVRVVHACGMPEVAAALRFHGDVAAAVRVALAAGSAILADSRMTADAIQAARLPAGTEIVCHIDDPAVRAEAERCGTTRSATAVHLWRPQLADAVVVVGNAPTALFELLSLIRDGAPPPAAILAFPVGFVGAAEAKAALIAEKPAPFVTLPGRRGGSAMAGAALNAILAAADAP